MIKFKSLIKEKKNVILAFIAIILVIFTAYQLKLVGIAAADDTDVIETAEVVTQADAQTQELEQSLELENVVKIGRAHV